MYNIIPPSVFFSLSLSSPLPSRMDYAWMRWIRNLRPARLPVMRWVKCLSRNKWKGKRERKYTLDPATCVLCVYIYSCVIDSCSRTVYSEYRKKNYHWDERKDGRKILAAFCPPISFPHGGRRRLNQTDLSLGPAIDDGHTCFRPPCWYYI